MKDEQKRQNAMGKYLRSMVNATGAMFGISINGQVYKNEKRKKD